MDMHPVSLFDEIILSPRSTSGIVLSSNKKGLEQENNLIAKAIRLLKKETGADIRIGIHLEKKIPLGGGMGGGSSNAAGILVVLNRLFQMGFTREELRRFALELGSDVPFFIAPTPSIATGQGENLSPISNFSPLSLILLSPGFSISTGEAYSHCNISGRQVVPNNYTPDYLQKWLRPEQNDFWEYCTEKFPELTQCRKALMESGAFASGMSGSGSTMFGIYPDKKERDNAVNRLLKKNANWKLYLCETIPDYNYPVEMV